MRTVIQKKISHKTRVFFINGTLQALPQRTCVDVRNLIQKTNVVAGAARWCNELVRLEKR